MGLVRLSVYDSTDSVSAAEWASVWFRHGAEKRENIVQEGTRWLGDVGGREADFSTALLTKA
jgi:hypothetical protein